MGLLVGFRAAGTIQELALPLAAGIDRIRTWLIDGPLGLDPLRITQLQNTAVEAVYGLTPGPVSAARAALHALAAVVLATFATFFLLKDGAAMWAWVVRRLPGRRRDQLDGAGRSAWTSLSHYARGIVVVALIDAAGIGLALLALGVPLWVSLTVLTFVGAFVPLFGATVSGAVAVLVTLVTNGPTDALVVLVVVVVVQQVEGNVLHPLIVGRAVDLHPLVVLVVVTAGALLWGLAGALLAVPVTAAGYQVTEHLRTHPLPGPAPSPSTEPSPPEQPDVSAAPRVSPAAGTG